MLGKSISYRKQRQVKDFKCRKEIQKNCFHIKKKKNLHVNEEDLILKFQNMFVSLEQKDNGLASTNTNTGLFFQRKESSSKQPLRSNQDWDHLNEKGEIKQDIIQKRKELLAKHGFLYDEFHYLGRVVFGNKHLYDFKQQDSIGRTNFVRMQSGICPVDKSGEDILTIHHLEQTMVGPWVVLPNLFHQQYNKQLHSQVTLHDGINRTIFKGERQAYWRHEAFTGDTIYNKRQNDKKGGEPR
ncbi:MAG: hypothetical protein JSS07_00280 [Proteobacteria bacterium]|nr:hypothetical protein [Pseudomonadota bacterium]